MKQLLRKLIAGVDPRFLNSRESELLKQIDPQILRFDETLYRFNTKFKPGIVKFKKDGNAIFLGLDESEPLAIHPDYLHGAKEDDIVIVQRIMGRSRKSAAKVVSIVEHDLTFSIGIITKGATKELLDLYTQMPLQHDKLASWVESQEEDMLFLVDNRHSRIIKTIGSLQDPMVDEHIALAKYNREESFPSQVLEEVKLFPKEVDAARYPDRRDLRGLEFTTIDPVTAKDYDDAIYFDKERKVLYVAIADVSHYVQPESAIDAEAYRRGFSVYFPHKSVPMLPRELSETLCSLQPHTDRLAFVFEMPLNAQSVEVENATVYEAVIHSKRRFNYDEIDRYLDGAAPDDATDASVLTWLFPLQELLALFREKRMKKGYLFRSPEVEMQLDRNGMITHTELAEETPSHALIEDCMLLANIQAARMYSTGLFRVHEPPTLAKLDNLYHQLSLMGLRFKLSSNVKETITSIQHAAEEIDRRKEIDTLLIQTQMQAHYASDNLGHFGLGFEEYTHFTSPIRRYSDLVVHRLIKAILAKDQDEIAKIMQPINATAIDVSIKEREANDVAMDFARRKYARWALKHLGTQLEAHIVYLGEPVKALSLEPLVGAMFEVDQIPITKGLFDAVTLIIERADIKSCKLFAKAKEGSQESDETL